MIQGLRPYLKFVAPALLAVAATVATALQQGALDEPALEVGLVGLATATISFVVANGGALGSYAKALAPALTTLAGVVAHLAVTGEWAASDARAAAAGGLSAVVALLVPNVDAAAMVDRPRDEPSTEPRLLPCEAGMEVGSRSGRSTPPRVPE